MKPREIWLIAIVLAGVSFIGYVAVKVLGARHGTLLAAAAGGLVSSTAVAASNARRAAAGEGTPRLLAAGVALATAVSFARVVAIVAVLKPDLLRLIAPPLVVAVLIATAYALITAYWRKGEKGEDQTVEFRNPFSFWSVIGFAVLLAAIVLVGRVLGESLGAAGAIIGALALGLADVDAVTVSMARLTPAALISAERARWPFLPRWSATISARSSLGPSSAAALSRSKSPSWHCSVSLPAPPPSGLAALVMPA